MLVGTRGIQNGSITSGRTGGKGLAGKNEEGVSLKGAFPPRGIRPLYHPMIVRRSYRLTILGNSFRPGQPVII